MRLFRQFAPEVESAQAKKAAARGELQLLCEAAQVQRDGLLVA